MTAREMGISGLIVVDGEGRVSFSAGAGSDRRLCAAAQDSNWLSEARTRRLQSFTVDRKTFLLAIAPLPVGDVIIVSETDRQVLLDFICSVDFSSDVIEQLLSDPFEAMTVVDKNKKLVFISPIHEGFFGLARGEGNGRSVKDVIENTRLDRVIDTGKPEIGEVQSMRGSERIVSRLPIRHAGKVVGAIGRIMFKGPEQLERLAEKINSLKREVEFHRREANALRNRSYGLESLIGRSAIMKQLQTEIIKLAPLDIPVLVVGESGTGKELVGHALHRLSPRRDSPLVLLNAAALPATLVESELFGYEPGAFTGAQKKGRKGKFEQAANGTIFLDEIGDMPVDIQVKLLRVLQEKTVERIGGDDSHTVDFRLISATNKDLKRLVAEGKFRLDLYYRINGVTIEVPPLRARSEDIPDLAKHFAKMIADRHHLVAPELTDDAIAYLMEQPWPGNVRQLQHEVERACVFAENGCVTADILASHVDCLEIPVLLERSRPALRPDESAKMHQAVKQLETETVRKAMARHNGNKKRVAAELGISRSYLYKLLDLKEVQTEKL